mmetsp:Transcript_26231/g.65201  ORF Transcript_26231/g.65201 Transcript_26231/m.65201 type:complete len:88 (-) Transcript_26231:562-825(-)
MPCGLCAPSSTALSPLDTTHIRATMAHANSTINISCRHLTHRWTILTDEGGTNSKENRTYYFSRVAAQSLSLLFLSPFCELRAKGER